MTGSREPLPHNWSADVNSHGPDTPRNLQTTAWFTVPHSFSTSIDWRPRWAIYRSEGREFESLRARWTRPLQPQGTCWFWPHISQRNRIPHPTGNQTHSADSTASPARLMGRNYSFRNLDQKGRPCRIHHKAKDKIKRACPCRPRSQRRRRCQLQKPTLTARACPLA